MSQSLYEFLKTDVKKMIVGIGLNNTGNIYPLIMEEVERSVLDLVLHDTRFNIVQAAKLLGISRATLYRKIKAFNIVLDKK
jgi:DNA-binding protein Fis